MAVNKRDLDGAWRAVLDTIDGERDDFERFLLLEDFRKTVIRDLDLASGRSAHYAMGSLKTLARASHIGIRVIRDRIERWAITSGTVMERGVRPWQQETYRLESLRHRATPRHEP